MASDRGAVGPNPAPAGRSGYRPVRLRVVGAAAAACVAFVAVSLLVVGVDPRYLRLALLVLASAAIAGVVVLLPASWRARSALLVTAFLAAAGFLPALVTEPDTGGRDEPEAKVNARYVAELIRRGPFTEQLPQGLVAGGLADVGIGDPSAAGRLDAVQLRITPTPEHATEGVGAFSHVETYASANQAAERARAGLEQLKTQYAGFGGSNGTPENFCVAGNGEWICGGYRGLAYAEARVSPGANAYLPLATGTVSAQLRYADRMTGLASP